MKNGYTPKEIAKSLRVCATGKSCDGCSYLGTDGHACHSTVQRDATDLIEAQDKRIRELESQLILRQDELLKLREENRWIPVEERMPEVGELVQTVSDEGVREGCFLDVNGWWRLSIGVSTKLVTHWRPVSEGVDDWKLRNRLEQIRAMGVDELARRLLTLHDGDAGSYCRMKPECEAALENNTPEAITDEHCLECVKAWLLEEI